MLFKLQTQINLKNPTNLFNYRESATQPAPENPTGEYTCNCHLLKYKKFLNHHSHIDTNDTKVITTINPKLTYLAEFAKYGANYIPTPEYNPKIIQKFFNNDINKYITKLSKISKLSILEFENWKNYLIENFNKFILTNNPKNKLSHDLLKIKYQTQQIHKNYTITPTDKMKNNYRITCTEYFKRILYQKITAKEVLLTHHTIPNATIEKTKKPAYKCLNESPKEILKKQATFLTDNKIPIEKHQLPYMYPIFKSHKNGSRGVTASANIITTQLNITLHLALKLMLKTQLAHYNQKEISTNINYTWRIDNSTDLIHKLQQLNKNNKHTPKTLQSFDIEGFYDNVDIPELENIIATFIPKCFKIAHKQFIIIDVNKKHAYWANNANPEQLSLTEEKIIQLQNWQINNAIITYNNKTWK
eukprot:Phypoly_transcript_02147.p1 GENE.Phypoly_transcript_02147~~Phypoly_transcript_02147.p1  ORF type:complete len:417 (+),score=71.68 Phypoly_transcript_02147:487-1737(+)